MAVLVWQGLRHGDPGPHAFRAGIRRITHLLPSHERSVLIALVLTCCGRWLLTIMTLYMMHYDIIYILIISGTSNAAAAS
jgi:hypothetical protein